MKPTIYTLLLVFGFFVSKAQDTILLKDGTQIPSKIIEVGTTEIRYKQFANSNGPSYAVDKKSISRITYANGLVDVFENGNVKTVLPTVNYILKAHKNAVATRKDLDSIRSTHIDFNNPLPANPSTYSWVRDKGYVSTATKMDYTTYKMIMTKTIITNDGVLTESSDGTSAKRTLTPTEKEALLEKHHFPFYPLLDNPQDVTYIGLETVSGIQCHYLQCLSSSGRPGSGPERVDVWLHTEKYHQVKMANHQADTELVTAALEERDGFIFPTKLILRSKKDTASILHTLTPSIYVNAIPNEDFLFLSKTESEQYLVEKQAKLIKQQNEEHEKENPTTNLSLDDLLAIDLNFSKDEFVNYCTAKNIAVHTFDGFDGISFGKTILSAVLVEGTPFEYSFIYFEKDRIKKIVFLTRGEVIIGKGTPRSMVKEESDRFALSAVPITKKLMAKLGKVVKGAFIYGNNNQIFMSTGTAKDDQDRPVQTWGLVFERKK